MKSILLIIAISIFQRVSSTQVLTTAQRISEYNYPAEDHKVQTEDGYILTMFRIPYSPKLNNQNKVKPVIFLEHGLLCSSDSWVLNGPNDGLPYLLADAGFDVWLGNNRGTNYSKENVNYSSILPQFWDFSWNEIAIYDVPAMIDYILQHTNQDALHYVGHSQGTTCFFVLMSERPEYNAKIKTSHMLAPVAFMEHLTSIFVRILSPIVGVSPDALNDLLGDSEFSPSVRLISMLGSQACADSSPVQAICSNILFLIGGWDSSHLNDTLLPDVFETHPAGISNQQIVHYVQEYNSGNFCKYDYGIIKNIRKYRSLSPPNYKIKNIVAPIWTYYSDNDAFVAVEDVKKLQQMLPNLKDSFHVPYPDWNHIDFLFAREIKETINDRVVNVVKNFENMA